MKIRGLRGHRANLHIMKVGFLTFIWMESLLGFNFFKSCKQVLYSMVKAGFQHSLKPFSNSITFWTTASNLTTFWRELNEISLYDVQSLCSFLVFETSLIYSLGCILRWQSIIRFYFYREKVLAILRAIETMMDVLVRTLFQ